MLADPSTPVDTHARERARAAFQVRLTRASMDARIYGYPRCPLNPDATVAYEDDVYAVQWFLVRFDTMSPTQIFEVTVTRHRDGARTEFGQVIRKQRRSRKTGHATVRYSSNAGNHSTRDEVEAALVAVAAERMDAQRVSTQRQGVAA